MTASVPMPAVLAGLVAALAVVLGVSRVRAARDLTADAARGRGGRDGRGGRGGRRDRLDAVDLGERIARDVRSGTGLRPALEDALAASPTLLPEIELALRRRATLADALSAHRTSGDERDVLVHALQLGAHHPHVAGLVLDRAVAVVRERRTWTHERSVQSAQARASARVLTLLPIGFALWGVATSPSVRDAYTSSPVAASFAAIGVALNAAGWWWMRHAIGRPR